MAKSKKPPVKKAVRKESSCSDKTCKTTDSDHLPGCPISIYTKRLNEATSQLWTVSYSIAPALTCNRCHRPGKYILAEPVIGGGPRAITAANMHAYGRCQSCLPKARCLKVLYWLVLLVFTLAVIAFLR